MNILTADMIRAVVRIRMSDRSITIKITRADKYGILSDEYQEGSFVAMAPCSPEGFQRRIRYNSTSVDIPTNCAPRFDSTAGVYFYVITPIANRYAISRCPIDSRHFPKVLSAPIYSPDARSQQVKLQQKLEEQDDKPVLSVGKISKLSDKKYGPRYTVGKPTVKLDEKHPWRSQYPNKV